MLLRRTLASLVLGLAVTAGAASADAPRPSGSKGKAARARIGKVPFRVVKLLPETRQALVFDRDRGAHVLVSEGERLGAFDVVEIDDDQVVLGRDGREVILVVDPDAPQPAAPAVASTRAGEPRSTPLLDPYLDLLDPYGLAAVREVLAPPEQRASMQDTAVVDPYADRAPTVVPAPAAAKPIAPTAAPGSPGDLAIRKEPLSIQRRELEAALADFARLGSEVGFTRVERGVRLGKIASGSYFWTLGLRPGDVATAIDGKPMRGIDDAAAAYARLGSAKQLAIDVDRAGTRGTLRFQLR